jgi:hypothetical protein
MSNPKPENKSFFSPSVYMVDQHGKYLGRITIEATNMELLFAQSIIEACQVPLYIAIELQKLTTGQLKIKDSLPLSDQILIKNSLFFIGLS